MFADFCSSLNYTHNCCKCLAISYGNISNAKFRSGCNLGLDNAN
nr:MAG TPA: hypothetical protein [Caudoviricetes sp.]